MWSKHQATLAKAENKKSVVYQCFHTSKQRPFYSIEVIQSDRIYSTSQSSRFYLTGAAKAPLLTFIRTFRSLWRRNCFSACLTDLIRARNRVTSKCACVTDDSVGKGFGDEFAICSKSHDARAAKVTPSTFSNAISPIGCWAYITCS